jgi:hypothetical protein
MNPVTIQSSPIYSIDDNKSNSNSEVIKTYLDESKLLLSYKEATIILNNQIYNQDFLKYPQYRILNDLDKFQYIAIFYSYLTMGDAGEDYSLYIVKYDKANEILSIVLDSSNLNASHSIDKNQLYVKVKEKWNLSLDISDKLKKLSVNQKSKLKDDAIKIVSLSALGIHDYNNDEENELIIRYDIKDTDYNLYLGSIYIVFEVYDGNLEILKMFGEDYTNEIISDIITNSVINADEYSTKEVKKLLDLNIIKEKNSLLYLEI